MTLKKECRTWVKEMRINKDIPSISGLALIAILSAGHDRAQANLNQFAECYEVDRWCVDTAPRVIGGETVNRDCWEYARKFLCYGLPYSNSCDLGALERDSKWELVNRRNEQYPSTYTEYDTVLPYAWIEEWQTTEASCDGITSYGCGPEISREDIVDGSGNVVGQSISKRCYIGETPRCNNDPNCSITEYTCTEELDGLCVEQQQTYLCRESGKCDPSQWEIMPELPDDEGAFSDAVAAAGIMDMIAQEASFDGGFSIFPGVEKECRAITGDFRRMIEFNATVGTALAAYFGGPLGAVLAGAAGADMINAVQNMQCCQDNPEDVVLTSSLISMATGVGADYCDMEDIELAAARLAGRAVQVTPGFVQTNNTLCTLADYVYNAPAAGDMAYARQICSHWTRPWSIANTQTQVDRYQRWCEFDSMLARLIQEQGRQQLAELASQNAGGALTRSIEFNYYRNSGGWTNQLNANGNIVRFWQWNEECHDEAYYADSMVTGLDCPSNTDIYAAICSAESCQEPPGHPIFGYSPGWQIHQLRAEDHHIRALNRYTVVGGGCYEDGTCAYDVHAWPVSQGGQMNIPLDMNWPTNFPTEGWGEFSWSHNNVHFEAYTHGLNVDNPTPRLRMCVNSNFSCQTGDWTEIDISNGIDNIDHYINSSPPISLTGGCSSGECDFRANIEVTLTAKPWSTYSEQTYDTCMLRVLGSCVTRASTTYDRQYHPDCSGFTLDEFLALDLGKMDFSEYIETLSEQAKAEFSKTWLD